MEAICKFDFSATAHDELSFKKGETIKILGTKDDWYRAERSGMMGFVPKNYITLSIPRWYQEDISRQEAESMLKPQPIGAFIIRDSQSSPGDLSISVRHESNVQHFKVLMDRNGQYFLWNVKFNSLNKLVDYYTLNSVSKQSCVRLLTEQQSPLNQSMPVPRPRVDVPSRDIPHPRSLPQERGNRIESQNRLASPQFLRPHPEETLPPPQSSLMQVKALYDFTAEETDELGFNAGDVIEVLEQTDNSWWKGRLRGRCGLIPANYTIPL